MAKKKKETITPDNVMGILFGAFVQQLTGKKYMGTAGRIVFDQVIKPAMQKKPQQSITDRNTITDIDYEEIK